MLIRDDAPSITDGTLPNALREPAWAKVNLFLEILGKRADGFHEIATLMLAVNLGDELTFHPTTDETVRLTTDVPGLSVGPDNLVLKAAELLRRETGCRRGAAIHLQKRIPWAAGLGGGSSDAAATLRGLNRLWGLQVPTSELRRMAGQIGSDVPFFVEGQAAWATGRGEIITPVTVGTAFDLVLVKPEMGLGTADVYRRLTVPTTPVSGTLAEESLKNGDVEQLGQALFNRLQEPAFTLAPVVADWHRRLCEYKTAGALMSGSGSCLFVLCRNTEEARQVADDLSSGLASEGVEKARVFQVRSLS